MNPDSRVLRKDIPLKDLKDLDDKNERKNIEEDLSIWTSKMKLEEENNDAFCDENLPPIRGSSVINHTPQSQKKDQSKSRPVKPREYRDWDKIDIDKELEKVDGNNAIKQENKNVLSKPNAPSISDTIDTTGLPDEQKVRLSEKEKLKGNEAYQAGDYVEALKYYTRSISVINYSASYNNRALTYMKLEKFDKAIEDLENVLEMEPQNVKALIRRASCFKEKKQLTLAKKDIETALNINPSSKHALVSCYL